MMRRPHRKSDFGSAAQPPLTTPTRGLGGFARIGLWALQALAAAAFLTAGLLKLTGAPMMIDIFAQIGVGQWFRYFTGLVEVAGGLMLLVPHLAGLGGFLLATTMACAIFTHLLIIGGDPTPAVVLLLVTGVIAWARRKATLDMVLRRR
jgi:putative oxidoreductase